MNRRDETAPIIGSVSGHWVWADESSYAIGHDHVATGGSVVGERNQVRASRCRLGEAVMIPRASTGDACSRGFAASTGRWGRGLLERCLP